MLRKIALSTAASLALASAVQAAPVSIGGTGATGVSYTGSLDYNSANSILTVELKNTSGGSVTYSALTAFAFNIAGDLYLEQSSSPFESGWDSLTNANDIADTESTSPFGFFEAAAGVGSKFLNGSGQDADALQNGQSGVWSWFIKHKTTGAGAGGSVNNNTFLSEGSKGGGQSTTFLVRFKGIQINGQGDFSDKVTPGTPGTPVPLPAAAWTGMAMLAGLGVSRLRKRRRD